MELSTLDLRVRFDGRPVLDGLSLELPMGTRALVTGTAGAGKTTLLKVLAGLIAPTGGTLRWNGRPLAGFSDDEKRSAQVAFGMVFQTDALFDSMTVLENVLLPLRKRKVAEAEARARAEEALRRVGLGHALEKRPETLSGGMKKRVGVARAIVARPDVLLADDPFAGLDPHTEQSIAELLLEVSAGKTLLVALPDPVPSLPLARVLRLSEGRLT